MLPRHRRDGCIGGGAALEEDPLSPSFLSHLLAATVMLGHMIDRHPLQIQPPPSERLEVVLPGCSKSPHPIASAALLISPTLEDLPPIIFPHLHHCCCHNRCCCLRWRWFLPYYPREGSSGRRGSASGRRSCSTTRRPTGEDMTSIFRPSMRPIRNRTTTGGKVSDPV